jgi:hypothetical protein
MELSIASGWDEWDAAEAEATLEAVGEQCKAVRPCVTARSVDLRNFSKILFRAWFRINSCGDFSSSMSPKATSA